MNRNNSLRQIATLCALLGTVLLSPLVAALPTDRDQPIHIDADNSVLDQNAGVLTYTGNVVIDQGSIHIEAEKAVIYSRNNEVYRLVATGGPAHFQQQPELNKPLVKARGRSLVYDVAEEKLTITEQARVEQDGSVVTGDLINYDIHRAIVEAGRRTENSERVKVILQPQSKKPAEQDAP